MKPIKCLNKIIKNSEEADRMDKSFLKFCCNCEKLLQFVKERNKILLVYSIRQVKLRKFLEHFEFLEGKWKNLWIYYDNLPILKKQYEKLSFPYIFLYFPSFLLFFSSLLSFPRGFFYFLYFSSFFILSSFSLGWRGIILFP